MSKQEAVGFRGNIRNRLLHSNRHILTHTGSVCFQKAGGGRHLRKSSAVLLKVKETLRPDVNIFK